MTTTRTIREILKEEGKVIITKEQVVDTTNNVPHLSLFTKLQQLQERGIITSKENPDTGGSRMYYNGHLLDSVNEVVGKGEYSGAPEEGFRTPHDVSVCHATQSVLAWAPSI